jgi:hypothetical protein
MVSPQRAHDSLTKDYSMSKFEVFVITAEGPKPKRLQLEPEATCADLIAVAHLNGGAKAPEEIFLFLEDEDEPLPHSHKLRECKLPAKPFLHCHRCRHVAVTVYYNGAKEKRFAPSATVSKVLKWSVKEFGLTGQDAEDKVLRVDAKSQPLEPEVHIGSLAKHTTCSLNLYLTPLVLVEG